MSRVLLLFLCAASTMACSHKNETRPDAAPPDGGPWACPPNPPALGTPCPPPLSCEYESALACNDYYQCTGTDEFSFMWTEVARECASTTSCQVHVEAGSPCTNTNTSEVCSDNGMSCHCGYCTTEAGYDEFLWQCSKYGPAPECPVDPPRFGSACANEGLVCDYRDCFGSGGGTGPPERCLAGLWIADETAQCMPSQPSQPPSCP